MCLKIQKHPLNRGFFSPYGATLLCYGAAPMMETPQFGTAEYQEQAGIDRCKTCNQPLAGAYYRVSGALTCQVCAQRIAAQLQPDTHNAFVRGVVFGIGGALVGLILYSSIGIMTGLEIGYMSLAVGYIVARAIMMGSSGIGGRRYQIAAVILTYMAVSLSAVPIALYQLSKQPAPSTQQSQTRGAANESAASSASSAPSAPSQAPAMSFAAALGYLALLGLASPLLNLLDPLHGLIGLVILFVGLQIAWRSTVGTRIPIMGPFNA